MARYALPLFVLTLGVLGGSSTVFAQSAPQGLSRAIRELRFTPIVAGQRSTDSLLFEARVVATIVEADMDAATFLDNEQIRFEITPRSTAQRGAAAAHCPAATERLTFTGSRLAFEAWSRDPVVSTCLLALLFPANLGASVLGRAPSVLHAEHFLLTTAFAEDGERGTAPQGRWNAGGLLSFESLQRRDSTGGDSGWAWDGLYGITRTVSVHGRFARQREGISTSATSVGVDYHPYVDFDRNVRIRVGGTARGGLLYSRSRALDLGSLEFGGGGFLSLFKNLGRVRVGGGSMLQASKSHVPDALAGDDADFGFLAEAINDRGVQWDVTYGGSAGIDMTSSTTALVKVLDNRAVSSRDERSDSWLVLAGLSYRFGYPSVNFGYKFNSSDAIRAHAVFFQGNFNW